ncbi:GntR family transcriptional regulator [Burkholderia anthina]|uniref:GntR family transcriptional regulator n=1 Tax=Burkholderia anthina TaxID=179879 RepID=UPI00158C92F7|nr:GntR family transcriptional regulator [Burkholderia anthina]
MIQIDKIQQKIRDDIVAGRLPFGARVTIAELATRYNVSTMPIREALRALQGEGLLTIEPNRGARIRTVDHTFVSNIFDIRGALEVLLVRRVVEHVTRADLLALEEIQNRYERCIENHDFEEAVLVNREFHTRLNSIAQNPDAVELLDRHWFLIAALWHRFENGPERFSGELEDHRHIIKALAARDVDAAATLMGAHVVRARHILLGRMERDLLSSNAPKEVETALSGVN